VVFQKYHLKSELGSVEAHHPRASIWAAQQPSLPKSELLRRIKLRKGAQDARLRAEIIPACAAGESGNDIAQRLGTSKDVVSRWRQRFSKLGLLGLNDEPRSGRPRTISDEQV
jgi:hypothetical protein